MNHPQQDKHRVNLILGDCLKKMKEMPLTRQVKLKISELLAKGYKSKKVERRIKGKMAEKNLI